MTIAPATARVVLFRAPLSHGGENDDGQPRLLQNFLVYLTLDLKSYHRVIWFGLVYIGG